MPEPFDTPKTAPEPIQRQREALRNLRRADRARQETTVRIAPIVPRGLGQQVSETLPQAVERIVRELQPEAVILFGSYAYGAPTPDSDVDLLVVMETDASPRDRHLAVARLLRPRLFPVDILVRTPDEIRRSLGQRDFFLQEIFEQGKVLYERPH